VARRQRFGRLVLLDETEASGLGQEYRAARLGPSGLDRIVTVLKLNPEISAHPDAHPRLLEQARFVSQLQSANLLRVLGIGKVEESYYLSYEHLEGRSVRAILDRCRQDGFPFAVEHALQVASRTAAALEYIHGHKDASGKGLFHGLLSPSMILISYEGEVKVKGLGSWAGLCGTSLVASADRRYLAPEQAAGGPGDARSDAFALGAILFEALTGQAPDASDLVGRLRSVRLATPTGGDEVLPRPLAEILRRSVASDPAGRYPEIHEMRRAIDTVLFSGDFAPTTFNLAFFMHTLFREDIERGARQLEEDRQADYQEFLAETAPPPAPTGVPDLTVPIAVQPTAPLPAATEPLEPPSAPPARAPRRSGGDASSPGIRASARDGGARTATRAAAAGLTLHRAPSRLGRSRGVALLAGVLGALASGGAAGYLVYLRSPAASSTPVTTISAQAAAALARVRELEARIADLEREKAEAEARAAEQARQTVEAQAVARGRPVDPTDLQRAQEEARRRARIEQLRRQEEELRRLAEEKLAQERRLVEEKRAEEERLGPEQRAVETGKPAPSPVDTGPGTNAPPGPAASPVEPGSILAPASATMATPVPPATAPTSEAPPTTAPAVAPGSLVAPEDPDLTPPVLVFQPRLDFPSIAFLRRAEGTVLVRALVDETGRVSEVRVVRPSVQRLGFDEEAVAHARKRRYRPATKNSVPVKTWVTIEVRFVVPK